MAILQIRISEEEKKQLQKVCDSMGMTMSGAIKIFLRKIITEKKIPFEITGAVRSEARDIISTSPFSKKNIE